MSNLVPASYDRPQTVSHRQVTRSVGRSLAVMGGQHTLEVARVRASEDLEVERIHAVESITNEGVMSAAHIMSRARILMDMSPMDAGIIQSIGQLGCVSLAEIVGSSGRRVR
jgi:excinuclease UvrABC helicase subunit UvrB